MLDSELCKGCTTCVKRCPTEAIRVRDKKAFILKERCVDCGECIRVCPHHAKKAVVDSLDVLKNYEYTVALPAPTLYGQFKKITDRNTILTGLKRIGFDDVFEVSAAAEAISAMTHTEILSGRIPHPIISTACPAILRIIRVRFPSLIPHLLDYRSPMELAARWGRRLAMKKTGLPPERIGCIFISPCPAKATSAKNPLGTQVSTVNAIVSIADVFPKLTLAMKKIDKPENLVQSGAMGVGWAVAGGECAAAMETNHLAASGMESTIRILEALEDDKLANVDLIELNACVSGCVGGVLTVENPFIAKAQLANLMRRIGPVLPSSDCPVEDMRWDNQIVFDPVLRLDSDVATAMDKLERIKELQERFNGMDCGACGAPSCRALAEDIIRGVATEDQCIFVVRERLQRLLDDQKAPQECVNPEKKETAT
jgi:iron only hydrogenase large subunit-like protein